MSGEFDGRAVIITGGGGGLGLASVQRLVDDGANVVAVDLPGAGLDEAAQISPDQVLAVEADVASADAWQSVLSRTLARFGAVHGLFNNAGIEGAIVPILEYPDEMFDRVLSVNVRGVWLGLKAIAPAIAEHGGGSIVNTSSVAGLTGSPNLSAYSASKHAVIGLTKSAAKEFAPMGVRVNAMCPSPFQTRMMRSLEDALKTDGMSADDIQGLMAMRIPLGRYGEPPEVAELLAFLLSERSSFLTGVAMPIDGGMTA